MIKNLGKRKLSIRQEVFYLGVTFSLVTLLVFGSILCVSIYLMQVNHLKQAIHDANYHMAMISKNQSQAISNTLQMLSNNSDVRSAGFSDDEALVSKVVLLYRDYYNADNNITYIYSGYENARIIIDNWILPEDFDPRERPWYKYATEIKDNKVVLGRAYQDASTRQWLISSSTPLYGMNGEFVGVLSIDRSVENMSSAINEKNLYESQYSFIVDRSGKILVHPDPNMIQKTFSHFANEDFSLSGEIDFNQEKEASWAFYSSLGDSEWFLITIVNKHELLVPLYQTMAILAIISILIALFLGAFQSKILNTRLARPLIVLGDRIKNISNGEKQDRLNYYHSNHEILEIAQNIEKLASMAVKDKEEKLKTILFSVADGVIATDRKGIIEFVNPVAKAHINRLEDRILGRKIEEIFEIYSDMDNCKLALGLPKSLKDDIYYSKESYAILRTQSGAQTPIEYSISPIKNSKSKITGMVIVFRDYTVKKRKQEKIEYMSYHDPLTGINNRRYFDEKIIELDKKEYLPLTIIYADINGLKLANDLKGHATGDKLIKLAASSIKKELRTNDIFSRIGGDEFGIVLPQTGAEATGNLIERIRNGLEDKKVDGISLSISFGYATKYKIDECINNVITDSDSNMYSNKIKESPVFKKNTIIDFKNALENKLSMSSEDKLRTEKICDVAMREMGIKGDE